MDCQNLKDLFLHHKKLSEITTADRLPYLTDKENIFVMKMPDSSMHPTLPINSYLFFEIVLKNGSVYLIYMNKYDLFLVREFQDISEKSMVPKNLELFNKTQINDDVLICGKLQQRMLIHLSKPPLISSISDIIKISH